MRILTIGGDRRLSASVAALSLLGLLVSGCPEDVACVEDSECPEGQVCRSGFCELALETDTTDGQGGGDVAFDGTTGDTGTPGDTGTTDTGATDTGTDVGLDDTGTTDTGTTDTGTTDTGGPKDTGGGFDMGGQPDETPPTIIATDPEAEEEGVGLPFVVTIVFSEPIRKETVDTNTFKLRDVAGKSIGGAPALSADGVTVTLTPEPTKLQLTSPYTIEIDSIVQDVAGNHLEEPFVATFYTGAPANLGPYATIAAQFSPTVHQAVRKATPKLDYPTRFDLDGDWEAIGNVTYINEKAKEIQTAIYWDVSETKSHAFITYTFFWPYRDTTGTSAPPHANDTAGLVIVAEKHPELKPIAAYTYGRIDEIEEVYAFVAEGSLIQGKPHVTKALPEAELFPDGRFQSYLTTGHQSCAWATSGPNACVLNEGIKKTLLTVVYAYDQGQAATIKPEGGSWPTAGEAFDYQLLHGLLAFWPRRDQFAPGGVWEANFDYEPLPDRPGQGLKALPSFFDSPPNTEGGRPAWAWRWQPGLGQFYDMPKGTLFLDPAIFVAKRHSIDAPWDPDQKTGFSLEYCWNPYLGIDLRGTDPDCPAL